MATKKQADTAKLEKAFNKSSEVKTHDDLKLIIERAKKAQKIYATFTQEQVDKIFKAAATAADKKRIPLAQMAVEDTFMQVQVLFLAPEEQQPRDGLLFFFVF